MSDIRDIAVEQAGRLERRFAHIAATAMLDMPMNNPVLLVQCVGLQPYGAGWLGVLITPWFMNLVLVPSDPETEAAVQTGTKIRVAMPGGTIEFIQSQDEVLGPLRMCSLFSPAFEFSAMEDAVLTAEAVLAELLAPEEQPEADADVGMVAIWEGRLADADAQAERERQAEAIQRAEEARARRGAEPEPAISRRALFGLPAGPVAEEVQP
ncbi:[NiFe]-hydrogenase assembly chaperone HybE [Mesorhizobium sp. ArgA1]